MSCDPELVTGYVDGVLAADDAARVAAHIESCATCQEQQRFETELRARIRSLPPVEPRPELEAEIRTRLRRRRGGLWKTLLPLAAVLVGVAVFGRSTARFVAWELSADHEGCYSVSPLPAEVWGDPARVSAWFAGRGHPLPQIPASAAGLELLGGRRCELLDGSVAAHLYYATGVRHASVFVLTTKPWFRGTYAARSRGYNVRLLRSGGLSVGLVADRAEETDAFQRTFVALDAAWKDERGLPGVWTALLTPRPPLDTMLFLPVGL